MNNPQKNKALNDVELKKNLKKIDIFFRGLEKDKSLPTFPDFFMSCLIFGIAENVNLKRMYPKTYGKLNSWLKRHNETIRALQRRKKLRA